MHFGACENWIQAPDLLYSKLKSYKNALSYIMCKMELIAFASKIHY